MLSERLGIYTGECLKEMGVKIVFNSRVRAVTARTVQLGDGVCLDATLVVCTVGNAPHPKIKALGGKRFSAGGAGQGAGGGHGAK